MAKVDEKKIAQVKAAVRRSRLILSGHIELNGKWAKCVDVPGRRAIENELIAAGLSGLAMDLMSDRLPRVLECRPDLRTRVEALYA